MGIYSHFPFNIAPTGPTGATGPTGPTGPTGSEGTAASVQVGSVTTGDAGTEAAVVNSGTPQNAVLDFTIPKGATGSTAPISLLSAYSTPTQATASGSPMLFDQNSLSYGAAITHTAGAGPFTITQPGLYLVSFHGTVSATPTATFPVTIVTSLEENGAIVPGASIPHNFQSAAETEPMSFSVVVAVTETPTTLQVVGTGGSYLSNAIALTITRLGDVPS